MNSGLMLEETPVTALRGVGKKRAALLSGLGISTVLDVLFHLPLRYQDRTRITPICSLQAGEQAVVEAVVDLCNIRYGRRRSLLVSLSDGTGSLVLRFFHFSAAQQNTLSRGVTLRCFGEIRNGPSSLEMVHPEYKVIREGEPFELEQSLTPVYPTTEGMHQLSWRDLTDQALSLLKQSGGSLNDCLPQEILGRFSLANLSDSLALVHRPPVDAPIDLLMEGRHPAQQRLAFDELLSHQVSLRGLRQSKRQYSAHIMQPPSDLQSRLIKALPFSLTPAQRRALETLRADLASPHPMLRLLQGDVGSGKTIVAALAALQALDAGHQVAFMAPTELLAEQHLQSLQTWLLPLGVPVMWLTGRHKGKERAQLLEQISSGSVQVIVGTHALFQADVVFDSLGFAIVDEQHRFGVHQRLALREKGQTLTHSPHQLIMTATPIPRSLAMTAYADLDLSVIDELPPGRTPVKTVVISDKRRDEVIERVHQACVSGRQAYWVCTLIEESEALQCQAAEETVATLAESLPDINVGLVHGRLKAKDKEQIMSAFKQGEIGLLVATTVIEVGVDVPNASLMIIENPERLGLAQLHQLRGRVGRGTQESHCVLMYHHLSEAAQQRLSVMRETNDGFVISEKDLRLRGPGEVLGTRQTGEVQFRIADLLRDHGMIDQVREVADLLIQKYPENAQQLVQRWLDKGTDYTGV